MPIDLALVLRDPAKLAELRVSQRKRSADGSVLDRAIALYGRLRTDRHALNGLVRPEGPLPCPPVLHWQCAANVVHVCGGSSHLFSVRPPP